MFVENSRTNTINAMGKYNQSTKEIIEEKVNDTKYPQ